MISSQKKIGNIPRNQKYQTFKMPVSQIGNNIKTHLKTSQKLRLPLKKQKILDIKICYKLYQIHNGSAVLNVDKKNALPYLDILLAVFPLKME